MSEKEKLMTKSHDVGSAPELPHHVAKQYNLHKEGIHPTTPTSEEIAAEDGGDTAELSEAERQNSVVVDDSKTDAAVDDILTKESDQILAVQDGIALPRTEYKKHRGFWGKVGHFFAAWWRNKWTRWITIIIVLLAIAGTFAWPKSRYAVLNTAGVRSSASVVVLDNTTQLPLKNVAVSLGSSKVVTNKDGRATIKDLKLGGYTLTIKRIAFAQVRQHVTIGWGSNPLGSFKIKATGIQYTLLVTDYISGKPVEGAEATSDEASAFSDKNGKIILTVDDTNITTLPVELGGDGYRPQKIVLDAASTVTPAIVLVPNSKEVYVSKQSGKFDVYSSDVDGQNKKVILEATGRENANISLVVSPDNKRAALISTRDDAKDGDGYLLQALTILNLTDGSHVTVDHAEQIQLVDWIGNRLIYRTTVAGASASNQQRNKLVSYNYDTNSKLQLATANQFNAVISTRNYVYYTVSSADPQAAMGLFKVKIDGSGRKRLSQDEIWTALRSDYNTFSLQTPDGWQSFNVSSEQFAKVNQPASLASRDYIDSLDGARSLWTDNRNGKGVVLMRDIAKGSDKVLQTQEGITSPTRWASDKVIIYRVVSGSETADYAISLSGGASRKLTDITATYGYARVY
jgi:hypothetical protein